MKTAVTGATGHLGAQLVQTLLAAGHPLRAVLAPGDSAPHLPKGVERITADVRDPEALRRAFDGVERVFHLAALVRLTPDHDGRTWGINVTGTRNVLDAAKAAGARRVIHCSSHHAIHRFPLEEPLHEERGLALDEPCAYHRSKAHAEVAVLEAGARGLDAVIVNPGTMLGPLDHAPSILGQTLIDLYHGRIPALPDAVSDYVDTRDVCAGILGAAERGRKGERYLLTGKVLGAVELAAAIQGATGRPMPRTVLPLWTMRAVAPLAVLYARVTRSAPRLTPEMVRSCYANRVVRNDKAVRELGFSVRPFADTLRDTFAWFGEQGWLGAR
jgi:dihydroflavonol-4-reductase